MTRGESVPAGNEWPVAGYTGTDFQPSPDYPPPADYPSVPEYQPGPEYPAAPGHPVGPDDYSSGPAGRGIGHPAGGYPPNGYPSNGFPVNGYPATGYPAVAHDEYSRDVYGGAAAGAGPGFFPAEHAGSVQSPVIESHVIESHVIEPPATEPSAIGSRVIESPAAQFPAGYAPDELLPAEPEPASRPRAALTSAEDARRAMLGYLTVPIFGFVLPLTFYLLSRRRSRWARAHAAQALNVWLTGILYDVSVAIMGAMLALDSPQIAVIVLGPVLAALWLVTLTYLVRAANAASRGQTYPIPRWLCSPMVR